MKYRVLFAVAGDNPDFTTQYELLNAANAADGEKVVLTMHHLYIFYEDAIPETTAQRIGDLEQQIATLADRERKSSGCE